MTDSFENDIKELTEDLADTLIAKNHDYGSSFEKSMDAYGDVVLLIRLGDKFNRLKNLIMKQKQGEVTDESVEDTLKDLAGYAILGLQVMDARDTDTDFSFTATQETVDKVKKLITDEAKDKPVKVLAYWDHEGRLIGTSDDKVLTDEKTKEKYTLDQALSMTAAMSPDQLGAMYDITAETPYTVTGYLQHFGLPDEVKSLSDEEGISMTADGFSYKSSKPEMLTVYIPTYSLNMPKKTVKFTKESMKDLVIDNYWLEQRNNTLKEKVKKLESKRWWQR